MILESIPLFSMLKSRLGYVGEREKLIAQNVANADTPGYAPKDFKPFVLRTPGSPGDLSMVQPAKTSAGHLTGTVAVMSGTYKPIAGADSETTLDGNKVVLEDQMAKMTEARLDYEAALGFYQKSVDMIRLAARAPGR